MFDSRELVATHHSASRGVVRLDASSVRAWTTSLVRRERPADDRERIELLTALEEAKSALAALQARVTVEFVASQREEQRVLGATRDEVGAGISAQVALARHESPHRGNMLVGLATALVQEMPHTLEALESGVLSEHRARILVKETSCLTRGDRARVDAEVTADPTRIAGWGNRRLEAEAKKAAYRADPQAVVARAAAATRDRRVSFRPAPDTMVWLSALLPVAEGVSCYGALRQAAGAAQAQGDPRGRGQVMADTLVERLTGRADPSTAAVVVNLVMTDHALLGGGNEPAHLDGYGPVPAQLARRLVDEADRTWVRRLYTHPAAGQFLAMEARARRFPKSIARFIVLRDQECRTPWCDAPIRQIDHVLGHAAGGPTHAVNGQGLCEACNLAKAAPRWRAGPDVEASRAGPHTVRLTTPTGHTYISRAPDPPGGPPRGEVRARVDVRYSGARVEVDLAA